jgi:hypothetical protein
MMVLSDGRTASTNPDCSNNPGRNVCKVAETLLDIAPALVTLTETASVLLSAGTSALICIATHVIEQGGFRIDLHTDVLQFRGKIAGH